MGTSGNRFIRIEIVHNFQLFGNAGVITLPWLRFNVWKKESKDFCEKIKTGKLYM
jgi:hypothetical protein